MHPNLPSGHVTASATTTAIADVSTPRRAARSADAVSVIAAISTDVPSVELTVVKVDGIPAAEEPVGSDPVLGADCPEGSEQAKSPTTIRARSPTRLTVVARGRDHLVATVFVVGGAEEGQVVVSGVIDEDTILVTKDDLRTVHKCLGV